MPSAEHEREIQDLMANGANEPLGKRVGPGSPNRGLDHPGTFGGEHLIEGPGVLRVTIPDQEPEAVRGPRHRKVSSLLGAEVPVGVASRGGDVEAPAPDLDEEEHVERAQGRGLDGEEVTCPDPVCLSTQELAPARAVPAGCGLEPRGPKDLLHRGRSHTHPQLSALPLDPHVPPSWVLPCHPADELPECRVDGRAAEAFLLVRPFPPYELSVPTQQGGGRHDEGSPPMPRHHARAGGQEGLVDSAEPRSSDLAGEHLYLVPKDDDLDLQFAIRARIDRKSVV